MSYEIGTFVASISFASREVHPVISFDYRDEPENHQTERG